MNNKARTYIETILDGSRGGETDDLSAFSFVREKVREYLPDTLVV